MRKNKSFPVPADSGAGETVSYDKEGRIERPSTSLGVNFPLFKKLFLPITIILVAGLSFGIGRLSVVGKREAVRIEYNPDVSSNVENINPKQTTNPNTQNIQTASVIQAVSNNQVVGSKNGTKYHYSYCSGAKQIKEENKIVFATPQVAESAGYTLAANCSPR